MLFAVVNNSPVSIPQHRGFYRKPAASHFPYARSAATTPLLLPQSVLWHAAISAASNFSINAGFSDAYEETTLREWCRKGTSEQRTVERARIILLSHEGLTVENIAKRAGHSTGAGIEVATALCQRSSRRFVRRAAIRQASKVHRRHGETGLELARSACARRVCAMERGAAGSGAEGRQRRSGLAHLAQARDSVTATAELVYHYRPGVRTKSGRCGGPVPESTGKGSGVVRRRKATHSGVAAGARLSANARWQSRERIQPLL